MRIVLVVFLALSLYLIEAKPLAEEETEPSTADPEKKDVTTEAAEEKDNTEEESDEPEDKKDEVEVPAEEQSPEQEDETKATENASETASEIPSDETKPGEAEESTEDDSSEGAKKDEVPKDEIEDTSDATLKKEDIADTQDNDENAEDNSDDKIGAKRDYGYGDHHGGDEGGHMGEHGHHEHDHHENDHHHHDHGYEFYEEWGEHGGHEGEHHGHHEGGHHGDHQHHHGGHRDMVPSIAASSPRTKSEKKWWLVGDHWGGWGHSNWGHPVIHHDGGGWQWGHHGLHHGGGHYKSKIPDCCKSAVDPEVTKRCGCMDGGHYTTGHHGGYNFHDYGSGHNDHDHVIHGPWSFGYDNFGDDWSDWDHNHHNFEHLRHIEHLPHDDNPCGHGHGRDCVPGVAYPFTRFYPSLRVSAPAGFGYGNSGFGYGNSGFGYGNLDGYRGYGGDGTNNYGVYGYNGWPVRRYDNYRVCHKCHDLPNGGSRCLCKSVRHHPLYIPVVHRPAHVYIDCDSSVHKFPHNRCVARADIPIPEDETTEGGSARQGAVYPYVGYGPWSAYPWWGDWWGGHGHHAWGEGGHGCGHGVGHGHGGGHGIGHGCGGHHLGRNVGFSFGGHGVHLQAYHCKDSVEQGGEGEAKTKRFCVPIGHHGGYGWPYWHGYPGVGTGLWGWGWPWIKNKVPGSKLKGKKESKKSTIPSSGKKTKKQTIHVGYGYASGDNYRLGYGMGGMGGVAGFTDPHGVAGEHDGTQFARSKIPKKDLTPEAKKDVTGTKRDIGFSHGYVNTGTMLGHPVTHPGYTTVGYPGHGDSSVEAMKNNIPKTKKSS